MKINRSLVAGMAFDQATTRYKELLAEADAAAQPLRAYPRGRMGLTPDHIKQPAKWRTEKAACDKAAENVRAFTAAYTNVFRADVRRARRERVAAIPVVSGAQPR